MGVVGARHELGVQGRPIIRDLRKGEAFRLLILNLLAATALLLALAIAGLLGSIIDDADSGSRAFQTVAEIIAIAALAEFILGFFFFALVAITAGRND